MKVDYILLSEKSWHKNLFISLQKKYADFNWLLIDKKEFFNFEYLLKYDPIKIFIPHWSYIIPPEIYTKFECIVFHMTDLPFGRGGSPLQNLIERGFNETKISAIKVNEGIDTGDVYLKKDLSLSGTALEIFERAVPIILDMITEIIDNDLNPVPQKGDIVNFRRRTPEMSNIEPLKDLEQLYNHIRMLDCEGYPLSFMETPSFRIEFSKAEYKNNEIKANVRITKK